MHIQKLAENLRRAISDKSDQRISEMVCNFYLSRALICQMDQPIRFLLGLFSMVGAASSLAGAAPSLIPTEIKPLASVGREEFSARRTVHEPRIGPELVAAASEW